MEYLSNYRAYSNAIQDDLWQALEEQAGIDNVILPTTVKAIMDSWTLKKNYPLITVTRDYNSDSAFITQVINTQDEVHEDMLKDSKNDIDCIQFILCYQERFLVRKSEDTSDTTLYQWWIPLTFSSSTSTTSS
jgi:aminopeptidase N